MCASMTSSALFASVAESIVILAPIDHVGCRRASAGVTVARRRVVHWRNGPPEAVSVTRATSDTGRPGQTLVDRGVFAVHRQELSPAGSQGGQHEISSRHERFLVGERQALSRPERRQRRPESGESHDRIQNDVDSGRPGGLLERIGAEAPFPGPARREVVRRRRPEDDEIGAPVEGEGVERLPPAVRREDGGAKPVRVAADDFERARADGSRGAEDCDVLQALTLR